MDMKIGISLTEKCSKNCWFCYADSKQTTTQELDFNELKQFIKELSLLPARPLLCFGGGEPFEYSRITNLIDVLEELKYPYSITSNLLYIFPAVSKIKHGWLWGSIHTPVDTDKVVSILKSTGVQNVGVNLLVMKQYKESLFAVTDKLESEQIPYILTFFKATGRGSSFVVEEFTANEKKEIIISLCRRYNKGVYTDSCQGLAGQTTCSCGKTWFTITADKMLKPNSFYLFGKRLNILSLAEFNRVRQIIPQQVHLYKGAIQ